MTGFSHQSEHEESCGSNVLHSFVRLSSLNVVCRASPYSFLKLAFSPRSPQLNSLQMDVQACKAGAADVPWKKCPQDGQFSVLALEFPVTPMSE